MTRKIFAYVTNRRGTPLAVFTKKSKGASPVIQAQRYAKVYARRTGKKVYPHWNYRR